MRRKHRPSQERTLRTDELKRDLEGQTAVLIAGGPSLTKAQIQEAKFAWSDGKCTVMGCNDAYRIAPWIDVLYACDLKWWQHHIDPIRKCYIDEMMTIDRQAAERYGLWWIPGMITNPDPHSGLSLDRGYLHTGGNSGFQLMNIAVLRGCSRLILLGYDCHMNNGKRHWFGDHPEDLHLESGYSGWIPHFETAARQLEAHNVEVINCSPGTAIPCFPVSRIGRVFA